MAKVQPAVQSPTKAPPAAVAKPTSPPDAPPSAAPGTAAPVAEKPKKEKRVRAWHPAVEPNAEGKPTKRITEFPADYDPKVHKPFSRKNFADESVFLEAKADRLERSAKKLRAEAEEMRKLGTIGKDGKAKKLLKLTKQAAELRKQLEASGLDVNAILAAMTQPAEEKTEAPAESK